MFLQRTVKLYRPRDILFRRVSLGDAADLPERTEGVEAAAAVSADLAAVPFFRDRADALRKSDDRRAVGVDIENVPVLGQARLGKGGYLLCERAELDAGGEPDPVV